MNHTWQLLMFPEGTDLSEGVYSRTQCCACCDLVHPQPALIPHPLDNIVRSHKYSTKMGLPKYKHVMHPRVTGFTHTLETLRCVHGSLWLAGLKSW